MNDSLARVLRTAAQLVTAGALYGLFDQIAVDVREAWQPYVPLAYTLLVTICMVATEQIAGKGLLRPNSPPAPANVPAVGKVS